MNVVRILFLVLLIVIQNPKALAQKDSSNDPRTSNVLKLVQIWSPKIKKESIKAVKGQFEIVVKSDGTTHETLLVTEPQIGAGSYPTVVHQKNGKPDIRISLDPTEGRYGIAVVTFYEYDAKGKVSEVHVPGKVCYLFAQKSAQQTQSHSDGYSHPEEDEAAMKAIIVGHYQSLKPPIKISDAMMKRIRNNCRNAAVIGQLSFDEDGISDSEMQKIRIRNQNNVENPKDIPAGH